MATATELRVNKLAMWVIDEPEVVGFGQASITPSSPLPLSGLLARTDEPAASVESPLGVHVCVVGATKPVIIVSFDLLAVGRELEERVYERLAGQVATPERCCLLVSTHTHSAPACVPLEGEATPDHDYLDWVSLQALNAVTTALRQRARCTLRAGWLRLPGLTYNRRAVCADGRVRMEPRPSVPVISRGPLDDRLMVLEWRGEGDPTNGGAIGLFAVHGVINGTNVLSADAPGALRNCLAHRLRLPCLLLQGASGDVNPTSVALNPAALAEWAGDAERLLERMDSALSPHHTRPATLLKSVVRVQYAPAREPDNLAAEIARLDGIANGTVDSSESRATLASLADVLNLPATDGPYLSIIRRAAAVFATSTRRALDGAVRGSVGDVPIEIAALRLGKMILGFVSVEPFQASGRRLASTLGTEFVGLVGYLSPMAGYLPDFDARALGGYEVDYAWRFYGSPGPFAPNAEQQVISELVELIRMLKGKGY